MSELILEMKKAMKIASGMEDNRYDILGGMASAIYFRLYLNQVTGKKYDPEEDIMLLVSRMNEHGTISGSISGLSGVYYLTKCLKKMKPDYHAADELYLQLEGMIRNLLPEYLHTKNFDFIHGATGIIWCLSNEGCLHQDSVRAFIDELYPIYGMNPSRIGFTRFNDEKGIYCFSEGYLNSSLSHGVSGLMLVLIHLYKLGYERIRIRILCERLMGLYTYFKIENARSSFCNLYPASSSFTRMAWCTGDMGIALAHWKAGELFGWYDVQEKGFRLMSECSKRRNLKLDQVYDAGFCHGSAGLCQMFFRFYDATGEPEFLKSVYFWLKQTRQMRIHGSGLAGYQAWQGDLGWQPEYGMLEGIAGIGLVLLSAEYDFEIPADWDKLFLLS